MNEQYQNDPPAGSSCAALRAAVHELALGHIDDPERTTLFDHASTCPDCQLALNEQSLLLDRLLLLAPEIEPPPGFENRVLAGLGHGNADDWSLPKVAKRRGSPRWRQALAAGVLVALGAGAGVVGHTAVRHGTHSSGVVASAARQGVIVRADGSTAGSVILTAIPRPHVLISIDQPRPFAGRATCELVSANGSVRVVGSWSYGEIEQGTWASGVDSWFLSAVTMNVRDPSGAVVASAALA